MSVDTFNLTHFWYLHMNRMRYRLNDFLHTVTTHYSGYYNRLHNMWVSIDRYYYVNFTLYGRKKKLQLIYERLLFIK